jgi:hypothetical protein
VDSLYIRKERWGNRGGLAIGNKEMAAVSALPSIVPMNHRGRILGMTSFLP